MAPAAGIRVPLGTCSSCFCVRIGSTGIVMTSLRNFGRDISFPIFSRKEIKIIKTEQKIKQTKKKKKIEWKFKQIVYRFNDTIISFVQLKGSRLNNILSNFFSVKHHENKPI